MAIGIEYSPSYIVVLWPDGQTNLALGFDACYQSNNEVFARHAPFPLRHGEECAGDWTRGMDDGVEVGVIIVMNMGRNPVDQSSMLGVGLL